MNSRSSIAPSKQAALRSSRASVYKSNTGTSSTHAFSLRPHLLFGGLASDGTDEDVQKPSLDYSDLTERIELFKELFVAHMKQYTSDIERNKLDHLHFMDSHRRNAEIVQDQIEKQKDDQKVLYQVIANERQAESVTKSQLSQLQTSGSTLTQRLNDAETQRDRLQAVLDQKESEREERRKRLITQVQRNRPELLRFNEKLGCRVSAGSDNSKHGRSVIKFTFHLIDPNDWAREANFVIDASSSLYQIVSHKPALEQGKLDALLAELNSSRALFTFIKKMRSALKDQIEKDHRRSH